MEPAARARLRQRDHDTLKATPDMIAPAALRIACRTSARSMCATIGGARLHPHHRQGRVILAAFSGEYGRTVVIDHGGGWRSVYAHLALFTVRPGDCVKRGAPIGEAGATGLISVPGLYFEVQHNGAPIDPLSLLPSKSSAFEGP
jgi:peptidase M23-like protein